MTKLTSFLALASLIALSSVVSGAPSNFDLLSSPPSQGHPQTPLRAPDDESSVADMLIRIHPAKAIWKKCIDVKGAKYENGTPLQMSVNVDCDGATLTDPT